MTDTRRIHSASHYHRREVYELLQSIFLAELLTPSEQLWLVSPWISDFVVFDRTIDASASLIGDGTGSTIRLTDVLVTLAESGSHIELVTKPNETASIKFCNALNHRSARSIARDRIAIIHAPQLHTKGLLGNDYLLHGSMNFTFSGIQIKTEHISFERDKGIIGQTRLAFEHEYRPERRD